MPDVRYFIHYLAKRSCIAEKIDDFEPLTYCDLTFVIDGSLNYRINGQSFTLGPGDAMFCPEGGIRKREKGTERTNYISINFRCSGSDVPLMPYCMRDIYCHDIDYCVSKLLGIYYQNGKYTLKKCSCLIEYVLFEMLERLSDEEENRHVALMKRYISYNWYRKISLDEISEAAHLSRSYSSAVFKKTVGMSISDYIIDIRISRACEMLRFSNESVADIADKTGFCDIFYFSKTFKRIKGISPLQYRSMK